MHVAPACAGSGEWSDHFGSYVRSLSQHFCKRLFPGLRTRDLMVTKNVLFISVKISKPVKLTSKCKAMHIYVFKAVR
jgi:hypothetical protein